jgi:hypothetical protein
MVASPKPERSLASLGKSPEIIPAGSDEAMSTSIIVDRELKVLDFHDDHDDVKMIFE